MAQTQIFEAGKVRIVREVEAFSFSYQGERFWAVKPAYGPEIYPNVKSAIERDGLLKPSFGMTIAYAHPAFTPFTSRGVQDTQDAKEIRKMIREGCLWGFTIADYRKGAGCFFYEEDDRNAFTQLPTKDLEARLGKREENKSIFSDDGRLRLAPFKTYKEGMLTINELAKSSYVTAQANGAEQAVLTAEIASTFKENPRLWTLESVSGQETRVSALDSDRDLRDRLDVYGYYHGDNWDGGAFGVSLTGEASHAEK